MIAPNITVDPVSMRQLNAALEWFIKETGRDSQKVLKDQGKLFVRDLLRATPPFGDATFSESYSVQRKIGEDAVERDIRKVFIPLRVFVQSITSPELAAALVRYGGLRSSDIRTKKTKQVKSAIDMDALDAIFRNMGMEGRVIQYANPSLHEKARGKSGRIRRATPYIVVNEKSIDAYIKVMRGHVGKGKAGWMRAVIGLAVKGIPQWISKHLTAGKFEDKSAPSNSVQSITVGNLVEYGNDFKPSRFEAAVQNRIRGMKTQVEKMAEYLAKKAARGRTV